MERRGSIKDSVASLSNTSSRNAEPEDTEFNYNLRGHTDNIEVEARLYEKNKEPDEKKMHFKKIADMAINTTDDHQKR